MSRPLVYVSVDQVREMPEDAVLHPYQVAALFQVDPKTVTRWCRAGKLESIRTPGGHRRIVVRSIRALLL